MPNHVKNVITVEKKGKISLADVHAAFINDEGFIDFNIIKPQPECLHNFEPHSGIDGAAKALLQAPLANNVLLSGLQEFNRARDLARYKDYSEEDRAAVERAIQNYKACGYTHWYDWNIAEWGTKWNAYGQDEPHSEDATVFEFETAWSHPDELIKILSKKLPAVTFAIKYADEDTGSNCGSYKIADGVVYEKDIAPRWDDQTPEQRRKFTQFAFELNHPNTDPRSYGYGKDWVYSEDVEEQYEAEQS